MKDMETQSHSFVIKIWLEQHDEAANQLIWRGHITHVPSGDHRYLQTLDDITIFMRPYLQGMGVQLDWRTRLRHWWRSKIGAHHMRE